MRQGTQGTLTRDHVSMQNILTNEYISPQGMLTREARKHIRRVGT